MAMLGGRRLRLEEGDTGVPGMANADVDQALRRQLETPAPVAVPRVTRDAVANRSYNQRPGADPDVPPVSRSQPVGPRVRATDDPGADDIGVPDDVAADDTGVPTEGANAFERWGTENIPGAEDLTWGDTGRLRGFATNEWGQNREGYDEYTIKNSFGKIASRYDPTQPNAARTLMADPDFQRLFPEARLVEHPKGDQIDFGNGDPVDVLINAVEGGSGEAWAWQPASEQGGGAMDAGGGGGGITASMEGLTGSDTLAAILAQIDALANGQNPAEAEALRRMLEG